uniref:Uncharacterized protein n=1 Tax=viral metagenome TaxID=1070528 RepID=A0A6C0E676_9ZZZZ
MSEIAKKVRFNVPDVDNDQDTDYEDEDPEITFKKLIKDRYLKVEEYGNDYESSSELKRNVELAFNYGKELLSQRNLELQMPEKDKLEIEIKNDLKTIMGSEYENNEKPCPKCYENMSIQYNYCQVCSRETVDIRCPVCVPDLFDLCSDKCKSIFQDKIYVAEIKDENGETFIVIEDEEDNLVLRVTNHQLFYSLLNEKDMLNINKPCPECSIQLQKNTEDEEETEVDQDYIPKIGIVPLKCQTCKDSYSYMVGCLKCFKKSGLKYICDECE